MCQQGEKAVNDSAVESSYYRPTARRKLPARWRSLKGPIPPRTGAVLPNPASVMSTRQHVSSGTFLANVRQSGLLTDAQLAEAEAKLPELGVTHRGRVVARALVELGLLTKFQ